VVNSRQEKAFMDVVILDGLLEESINWIRLNMNPEDVFPEEELEYWAENNGFVKEE